MVLGALAKSYIQSIIALFCIYFIVVTMAVYFYMFWTGRLVKLQRALAMVILFTAFAALTLVFFGDLAFGTRSLGSALFLPVSLSVRNVLPLFVWLVALVVTVLSGTKKSL